MQVLGQLCCCIKFHQYHQYNYKNQSLFSSCCDMRIQYFPLLLFEFEVCMLHALQVAPLV